MNNSILLPEYGRSNFRIEFDSEAEKKWNEKFEALEKKVVDFHIEKEVKKAEKQNVRISIKRKSITSTH